MLQLFLYGNSDLLAWFTALLNQEDENLVNAAALQVSGAFATSGTQVSASLQRENSQHISRVYCSASVETENISLPKATVCIAHTQEFNFGRELLLALEKQSYETESW